MLLHVYEWGDPQGEPLICLHGVTGYPGVYQRLAEERWSGRRVVAFDLRGHGRSDWEPPWTFATHVADLAETAAALGLSTADWVGHSFGGRLVLELASAHPQLVRRAALLDPAIQLLPQVAFAVADLERRDPVYGSVEEYVQERLLAYPDSPRAAIEHEADTAPRAAAGRLPPPPHVPGRCRFDLRRARERSTGPLDTGERNAVAPRAGLWARASRADRDVPRRVGRPASDRRGTRPAHRAVGRVRRGGRGGRAPPERC